MALTKEDNRSPVMILNSLLMRHGVYLNLAIQRYS